MRPLNVLYIIATLDKAGAESQMAALAGSLDRSAFAPHVCALIRGGDIEDVLKNHNVGYTILSKRHKYDFSIIPQLIRIIKRRNIDIVHTWLFTSNAYGRAAAKLAGASVIIASERCVDVWKGPLYRFVDRTLARVTDTIVANGEAVRSYVIEEGIPAEKVIVIPNGIDLAQFEPARRKRNLRTASSSAFTVGTVCRLEEQKGVDILLKAFSILKKKVPQAKLAIVGDGPDRAKLEQLARDLALDASVDFCGYRPDASAQMAGWDVFTLASRWEGLPNVIIEAMTIGVPVVATDVGATRDLVTDRLTGFLVPPDAPETLAGSIENLLRDARLRQTFSTSARTRIEKHYELHSMVRTYETLYRHLAHS